MSQLYCSFELRVIRISQPRAQLADSEYKVLASADGARSAASFRLPFSQTDVEAVKLGAVDSEMARGFGTVLFEALLQADILLMYRALRQKPGSKVRIQLCLSDVPELSPLPWELLFDSSMREFCALTPDISIVRTPDNPQVPAPLRTEFPIRVVAACPNPSGFVKLDNDQEWGGLQDGLAGLARTGLLKLEQLHPPTRSALSRCQEHPHIFHFSGHGDADPVLGGVLAFEAPNGREDIISAEDLLRVLPRRELRLVVLNACRSEASTFDQPFGGIAQRFIAAGTPAVVAMQANVAHAEATRFAQQLYREIGLGRELDDAVRMGRLSLAQNGRTDWAIPILFLQGSDGRLFTLPEATPEMLCALELQGLIAEAERLLERNDLDGATELLPQLTKLGANDLDAGRIKTRIEQRSTVIANYAEAQQLHEAQEWLRAWEVLDRVQAVEGDFKGTFAQIANCSRRLAPRINDLAVSYSSDLRQIVKALRQGQLVFVLGSLANRCGRPPSGAFDGQLHYLPDHHDLAGHLAGQLGKAVDPAGSLPQIAERLAVKDARAPLRALDDALHRDWRPTMLHSFLARLPFFLGRNNVVQAQQVIFTVNYDDAMERAFDDVGEPYDVLRYDFDSKGPVFMHRPWRETKSLSIKVPNRYTGLPVVEGRVLRSLIVKVYGAIDRSSNKLGRYVVTEDDYIDYLPNLSLRALLPATLLEYLNPASFLFLGYDLSAWSMRTFLKRFWDPDSRASSWSVPFLVDEIATKLWNANGISLLDANPEEFVAELAEQVSAIVS